MRARHPSRLARVSFLSAIVADKIMAKWNRCRNYSNTCSETTNHLIKVAKSSTSSCRASILRKRHSRRLITSGPYFLSTSLWNSSNCLEITGFAFSDPLRFPGIVMRLGFMSLKPKESSISIRTTAHLNKTHYSPMLTPTSADTQRAALRAEADRAAR